MLSLRRKGQGNSVYLSASSGISAAITESGPSFTESITSTVNPSGEQRIFIDLGNGLSMYYSATNWTPASTFKVSFKVAFTSTGTSELYTLGNFKLRIVNQQFIVITPDNSGGGGTIGFNLPSALNIDDLNEFVITGDVSSTLITLDVNGVSQTPTGTSTDTPNFTSVVIVGSTSAGSNSPEAIIADFKLEDLTTPSNNYTWIIDQDPGNTEDAVQTGKILTYNNISTGLPTRELFTLNGPETQWDGNNGTTLIIAFPTITTADITEVGPSFTESINVTLSTALIEAAITELGPSFTESIELSLTAKLNAAITEAGPSFTESIGATVLAQGVFANISENGPSFTESVIAEISKNILATITEQGPSFVESINVEIIKDVTVDITENGPSFTESIIASIPITITVNPRNIVRVKRTSNNVIIKRKSNTIRVR